MYVVPTHKFVCSFVYSIIDTRNGNTFLFINQNLILNSEVICCLVTMAQRTGVLIGLLVGGVSTEYTDTCVLTNKMPVISQPSLVTCFSRSERVCCGSAHDYLIGEAIQGLFPPSCAAKFKEFQNLFCSVLSSNYLTRSVVRKIKINLQHSPCSAVTTS